MTRIIKADTIQEAISRYPHKVGDVTPIGVVGKLTSVLIRPGLYRMTHELKPYDPIAELLKSATGVLYVSRDC